MPYLPYRDCLKVTYFVTKQTAGTDLALLKMFDGGPNRVTDEEPALFEEQYRESGRSQLLRAKPLGRADDAPQADAFSTPVSTSQ